MEPAEGTLGYTNTTTSLIMRKSFRASLTASWANYMRTSFSKIKMTKSQRDNLFFVLAAILMVLGGTTQLPLSPFFIIIGFLVAWFLVPNDKI